MVHNMLMEVILPYANFILFFAAAVFFFRKPAKNAAAKHKVEFERVLREASSAREAAEAALKDLQARQSRLDKEIAEIKTMSREAAELDSKRIVQEAERLASHFKEEAKRVAAAEVESAKSALRRDIVHAVRDSVSGKIQKDLNADKHVTLVKRQVGELKNLKAEGLTTP